MHVPEADFSLKIQADNYTPTSVDKFHTLILSSFKLDKNLTPLASQDMLDTFPCTREHFPHPILIFKMLHVHF